MRKRRRQVRWRLVLLEWRFDRASQLGVWLPQHTSQRNLPVRFVHQFPDASLTVRVLLTLIIAKPDAVEPLRIIAKHKLPNVVLEDRPPSVVGEIPIAARNGAMFDPLAWLHFCLSTAGSPSFACRFEGIKHFL